MWQEYPFPATVEEAVATLNRYNGDARIIAGGTDLLPQLSRGVKHARTLVDITRVPGLDQVTQQDGQIRIGSNVTHAQLATSSICHWPVAQRAPRNSREGADCPARSRRCDANPLICTR
jgi:CO/xanthine dehydrogenase FAD-binding subunit